MQAWNPSPALALATISIAPHAQGTPTIEIGK